MVVALALMTVGWSAVAPSVEAGHGAGEAITVGPPGSGADFNQIQPAIDHANPGDTIIVESGDSSPNSYFGGVTVNKADLTICSGVLEDTSLLQNEEVPRCEPDWENTRITGGSDGVEIAADGVQLIGFEVRSAANSGIVVSANPLTSLEMNLVVSRFHGSDGLTFDTTGDVDGVVLDTVAFAGNGDSGIHIPATVGSVSGLTVNEAYIAHNPFTGFISWGTDRDGVAVTNSRILNNGGSSGFGGLNIQDADGESFDFSANTYRDNVHSTLGPKDIVLGTGATGNSIDATEGNWGTFSNASIQPRLQDHSSSNHIDVSCFIDSDGETQICPPTAAFDHEQITDDSWPVTFEFTDQSTDDNRHIVDLQWDLAGTAATGGTVTEDFNPGSYDITLRVENSEGFVGRMTTTIELINDAPSITVLSPMDTTVLRSTNLVVVGEPVELRAKASDSDYGVVSGEFLPEGPSSTPVAASFSDGVWRTSYTYATAGTFDLTFQADDTIGETGTGSLTIEVVDNQPPIADAGPDQSADARLGTGVPISLTGDATDPENRPFQAEDFEWTLPASAGGGTLTGFDVVHSFPAGTHTVTLTVTDAYGLQGTDTVTVTIDDEIFGIVTFDDASQTSDGVWVLDDAAASGQSATLTVLDDETTPVAGITVNGWVDYYGSDFNNLDSVRTQPITGTTALDGTLQIDLDPEVWTDGDSGLWGIGYHELVLHVKTDSRAGAPIQDTEELALAVPYWIGPAPAGITV